ncbi:hypothetical protein JCM15765_18720 [Paradesulfitobacterium aromaticivorans]
MAFLRAMNRVIEGKETFMKTLMENIYRGLENPEREYTLEQLYDRLTELQQDLMSLVRLNAKTGLDTGVYDQQYSTLAAEIELMRERREKLKEAEAERVLRVNRVKEIEEYLAAQGSPLDKFDGDLFRRLTEKVKVQSMVEAVFVFKTGVEVREIL